MDQLTAQELKPLSDSEEAFFRALAHAFVALPKAFDADLMREHGMSLSEYLTLMHLSEAPERWMRMSDLAAIADLSLSGMTRVVARLEKQGLVVRERSASDGRSWYAVLTEEGLRALETAWPTHLASARRHVLDHLTGVDLDAITTAIRAFAVDACQTDLK
jgi:DNA-binding MarR family transcriptional regulator